MTINTYAIQIDFQENWLNQQPNYSVNTLKNQSTFTECPYDGSTYENDYSQLCGFCVVQLKLQHLVVSKLVKEDETILYFYFFFKLIKTSYISRKLRFIENNNKKSKEVQKIKQTVIYEKKRQQNIMMKLYLFFISLTCITIAQVWETLFTSFQINGYQQDAQGWVVSNNYSINLFDYHNSHEIFGGSDTFGKNSIISKQFSLPPHYKIQIQLEFWIIDLWVGNAVYIFIDDDLYSNRFSSKQIHDFRSVIMYTLYFSEQISVVMNHNSVSLILILTTDLDDSVHQQSWGISDFSLSILRCPQGCLYCQDNDYNNCYYWIGFLSLWHQSIELDGWMINNNIQPAIYKCVSFDLVGGYLNLKPNDKLEKIIENLNPHYKIQVQFQLWKIDSWINEFFYLEVDDQIYNQTTLQYTGIYSICGSTGLEKIINIGITLSHSLSQCKITMRTSNYITTNAYWGIRAFNIYLAKCFKGCDQCLGPLKTDCTVCSSEWVFYNNLCTQTPPMLFSQISINQIKDPKSDEKIPMEINLLEVDQQIITQGNFTQSFKNNFKILTIEVYVKCFPNKTIKSQFQSNKFQDLYLYQFQHNCQEDFNSVIYSVKFQQRVITKQELIINTSNTQCLIQQIVKVDDEQTFVKILEILLEDV